MKGGMMGQRFGPGTQIIFQEKRTIYIERHGKGPFRVDATEEHPAMGEKVVFTNQHGELVRLLSSNFDAVK
jgi:hypothetical protein